MAKKEKAVLFGSPHIVAKQILEMKNEFGIDTVQCSFSGGPTSCAHRRESMRLFAEEVIPMVNEAEQKQTPSIAGVR